MYSSRIKSPRHQEEKEEEAVKEIFHITQSWNFNRDRILESLLADKNFRSWFEIQIIFGCRRKRIDSSFQILHGP